MCVFNNESLPILMDNRLFENIVFNFFEVSNFYVLAKRNILFDNAEFNNSGSPDKLQSSQPNLTLDAHNIDNHLILEKFYINNGEDLSSKTLGYLNVQGVPGDIVQYCVSQNHEFAAVFTSNNILATFKIAELVFKEQQNKPPETINFGMEGLNSDQMY